MQVRIDVLDYSDPGVHVRQGLCASQRQRQKPGASSGRQAKEGHPNWAFLEQLQGFPLLKSFLPFLALTVDISGRIRVRVHAGQRCPTKTRGVWFQCGFTSLPAEINTESANLSLRVFSASDESIAQSIQDCLLELH